MENALNLWNSVKEDFKNSGKITDSDFKSFFGPITEVHKVYNNYIYLIADNAFNKFRIEKYFLPDLNALLQKYCSKKMEFKIISAEDAALENENNAKKALNSVNPSEFATNARKLRPEYTFENFVTGESNRFAFVSSTKVAESPCVTINPLYIFGDVGLGKTHLMMAIGHYVLDNNINTNVVYTTAQQFAEDYFMATSKKSAASLEQFYNYYRNADLLLVDDIQFLANKTATQEEFFKLFEYLFENNKQIVITSDRKASELENIMSRLKSRFDWGLPVDVKKPDAEHRKAILKRKLFFLLPDPKVVNNEALDYIATNFDSNVRELEGALRRFINYCVSFNIDFSLENAKIALESIIIASKNSNSISSNNGVIEKVKDCVAKYYNISVSDLSSSTRKKEVVIPRQIAVYIIRTKYDIPLDTIGSYFGNRDHSTISHAIDKITSAINSDWTIKQDIENIEKMLDTK